MTTNCAVNVGLSGSTGTGSFVGSNTPSLTTPAIGAATGTSAALTGGSVTLLTSGQGLKESGGSVALGVTTGGNLSLPFGQLSFPATQNPSANANTLDDYEEGTWTPVATFATPGDLNVVYSGQSGNYVKVGKHVTINFVIVTTTWTFTTASGAFIVTGMPFAGTSTNEGCLTFQGVTSTFTNFNLMVGQSSNSGMNIYGSASAAGYNSLTTANFTTTSNITIFGTLTYLASA